jgi:preprotein translocase subunit SecA
MFDPLEAVAKVIAGVGGGHIRRTTEQVLRRASEYEKRSNTLSDQWLREECLRLLSGQSSPAAKKPRQSWLTRLVNAILGRRSDPLIVHALALGVEAFRRNPADLPAGSRLYPQQVEAAVALTERCVIQMDTGEGKTYALLPAALALACRHPRVYVLCANDYLAERDATRTLSFWRFVGLQVGLAVEDNRYREAEWSAQIVYTTLREFMFKRERDQVAYDEPGCPMTAAAAVLVDEADAVLIDAAFDPYAEVALIEPSSFDWSPVLEIAAQLDPTTDIITDG